MPRRVVGDKTARAALGYAEQSVWITDGSIGLYEAGITVVDEAEEAEEAEEQGQGQGLRSACHGGVRW